MMSEKIDLNGSIFVASLQKWPENPVLITRNEIDVSELTISLKDFKYGENKQNDYTEPLIGAIATYENGTSLPGSQTFTDSRTSTASFSWTVTKGVSFTKAATINVNAPGVNGGISLSQTISSSTTETQGSTTSQTWNWSTLVNIPPKKIVTAKVFINKIDISTPFSAIVVLSGTLIMNRIQTINGIGGPVDWNTNSFSYPIGKLFSEFPDADIEVQNDSTIQLKISGEFKCNQGLGYFVQTIEKSMDNSQILPLSNRVFSMKLITADDPPQIGPPDGIHYIVTSQREETKPSVVCGFNDVGVPNMGKFLIETRQYEEYRSGKLVRSWSETIETFRECVPV